MNSLVQFGNRAGVFRFSCTAVSDFNQSGMSSCQLKYISCTAGPEDPDETRSLEIRRVPSNVTAAISTSARSAFALAAATHGGTQPFIQIASLPNQNDEDADEDYTEKAKSSAC